MRALSTGAAAMAASAALGPPASGETQPTCKPTTSEIHARTTRNIRQRLFISLARRLCGASLTAQSIFLFQLHGSAAVGLFGFAIFCFPVLGFAILSGRLAVILLRVVIVVVAAVVIVVRILRYIDV